MRAAARANRDCAAWCRGSAFAPLSTAWPRSIGWPAGCATPPGAWRSRSRARPRRWTRFVRGLRDEAPPLAHIESLSLMRDRAPTGMPAFEILHSEAAGRRVSARLARHRHLPRLPARDARSRRPALPLPVHQLHQLRPALHHHRRTCPTTGRAPPCAPFPCARPASASTTTRSTGAFTPSPTPARSAVRT